MLTTLVAVALAQATSLPITEVTVFSDRARVTRSGTLPVSGDKKLELAVLVDTVDASSVNVEVSGAELLNVELSRLDDDQLPVSEARAVLTQLEEVTDALSKVARESSALEDEKALLASLSPQVPVGDPLKPPPKLSPAGWTAVAAFAGDQLGRIQTRERELLLKQYDLQDKRAVLRDKLDLLGGAQRRTGTRVTAALRGNGPAHISVTYVALRARWYPTYDVQLQPDTGKVQVAFAGLVSQETGEDWSDAALTLSTAVPSSAVEFPQLLTWKIGTKERFIPTPTPVSEQVQPPPPVPPLPVVTRDEDMLRIALGQAPAPEAPAVRAPPQPSYSTRSGGKGKQTKAPMALEEKPPPAPPPMNAPAPASAPPARTFGFASDEVQGASAKADAPAGPSYRMSGFSLAPPPGYQRPAFAADLPAQAAGGYDLSWPSLQNETVQSGKGGRRVALFTQTWPVTTERKLFPALFPESFLTAELKNPAAWPLPAGSAHLYVGADPAGTAQLKLVSPGETFTLPLGIDRALKPVRNVKVVDAEKGLFSKDDFSEYTVSIQLANPYRAGVAVRVYDQIPVTSDKEVEVKLVESKPAATVDAVRGHLEWRLSLAAGQKTEVSFRYTLKRPKGWKMNQWEVAP